TNISSNSTYVNSNNKESVYFYINSDSSIYSYDHKLCKIQKEWLESLKRYSILITESNQKMQVDFINRQYKYLEEL
ncbi:MAG: hypothetical protein LIO93_08760, partial [Bacteroidales bacterium]|nr:hypothetical protein [Bacteroidales bacterium]